MIEIFEILKNPGESVCPKHHIDLVYRVENDELILKCEWCNYTLVPVTEERLKVLGLLNYNYIEKM